MGRRWRWGIRTKLLLFYAVAMLAAVTLPLVVQFTAYGAVHEFETRLSRYHAVHRFRVAFHDHYIRIERRLREDLRTDDEVLRQEFDDLWRLYIDLESGETESLTSYFNLRAVQRGLEAYGRRISAASALRAGRGPDWYQEVATAGRIAAYVDGYLSILLSEALDTGEARFRAIVSSTALVRNASMLALAGLAVFLGIFAVIFSSSVTAPIRTLARASRRMAAGDLAVGEVTAASGDEVEVLARSFNEMSKSIRTMVEDLRDKAELERRLREEERELMEKEKSLREAQFQSLQDQIRPHFLFNALNTIARTALFEGAAETEHLTLALGRLFHYSLGPASSLVTVQEEVGILQEYLAFQSLRFGERLKWDISQDKRTGKLLIPRFTLQPLVENAVRHGIEPLEDGGSIRVRIARRGDRLMLSVQDTGIGMDAKRTAELLSGKKEYGIGITNIMSRLVLRYAGQEKFSIHSSPGKGTIVRLSFPAEEGAPA